MVDAEGAGQPSTRPARVLFVCTANRVRSPFAEEKARSIAASSHLSIEFASAGTESVEGTEAVVNMSEVAARTGIDLSAHRSRPVTVGILDWADLVVTMTGQHVIDVVDVDPHATDRTVTLRELASNAEQSPVHRWDPKSLRAWLEPVVDRPISVLLGGTVDVDDPIGGPKRAYRRTVAEITELLETTLGNGT